MNARTWTLGLAATLLTACADDPPAATTTPDAASDVVVDAPAVDAPAAMDVAQDSVPADVVSNDVASNDVANLDVATPDVATPDAASGDASLDASDALDVVDAGPVDAPPVCGDTETVCDGRCTDLRADPRHCGACATACAAAQVCTDGRCVLACPTGQSACGDVCATLARDPAHCGACDTACPAGQLCADGRCACPAGQSACAGACRDLSSDPTHCGACETACAAGQVCAAGRCVLTCPTGQSVCGAACVTTSTDALHCGTCDTVCPTGARCEAGACRCPGTQSACGGACVDTSSSPAHCGACDRACAAADATTACVEGACRVVACAAARGDCDGNAANGCETRTDITAAHCGGCGRACALDHATAACVAGRCGVATCATGYGDCDGDPATGCEATLATDARNCGTCGTVCSNGCVDGRCQDAASCAALHRLDATLPSGRYLIDPDGAGGAAAFSAYCDMETDGGGWTLLATVTNSGDAANAGNWLVSTPTPNNWENAASFGTPDPTRNEDFRSAAFHTVPGRALMITHRNLFLLRTDDACLADTTLRDRFTRLGWECAGSAAFAGGPPCTHPCVIARAVPRTGDAAMLNGVVRTRLFLKAGEADGAQDDNRDRTYLSTDYRDNVDYPTGLGAFCSGRFCTPRTGDADVNDRSDAITPAAGTEFYGVWIR